MLDWLWIYSITQRFLRQGVYSSFRKIFRRIWNFSNLLWPEIPQLWIHKTECAFREGGVANSAQKTLSYGMDPWSITHDSKRLIMRHGSCSSYFARQRKGYLFPARVEHLSEKLITIDLINRNQFKMQSSSCFSFHYRLFYKTSVVVIKWMRFKTIQIDFTLRKIKWKKKLYWVKNTVFQGQF